MDKAAYLLTIDQSTSGTKGIIVNREGRIVARQSMEHTQFYPQPGWVEHDPMEIYRNVITIIQRLLADSHIDPHQIAGMTITNQRETVVIWDKVSGKPIYPAIVWQCQRTAELCEQLKQSGFAEVVQAKTGLLIDPYFSATKLHWILEHVAEAEELLRAGRLLAGTMDSWLIWKLSAGQVHATDYTNASRTLLYNIHDLTWDEELLQGFGVPAEILPEVKFCDEVFAYTNTPELFFEPIPITGIIGDSQAALFGQQCTTKGTAKATYGTGTSVMMNVGDRPIHSKSGLVSTIAWGLQERITYALEGAIRTTGDSIKWMRDHLELFASFDELDELVQSVKNSEGVYLVPAFGGLGAPYWDAEARAAIVGMNRGTTKAHLIRAALESIAYQIKDVFEVIREELDLSLSELRADGGASTNKVLMQFQADLLDTHVIVSEVSELSAMGSAYIGGLALGWWTSPSVIPIHRENEQTYTPRMSTNERNQYYEGWKQAVASVLTTKDV